MINHTSSYSQPTPRVACAALISRYLTTPTIAVISDVYRRAYAYEKSLCGLFRRSQGSSRQLAPLETPAKAVDAHGSLEGDGHAAVKFADALKDAETAWTPSVAAGVLDGAMTGVRHEEDEKVYTAPELSDVAHHAGAPDIDASQVNAFIQKTFDTAGLTAEDVDLKPGSMEAEELTEILSSVTAGIYFKHIASIKTA